MCKGLNKNVFMFQERKTRHDAMDKHRDRNIFKGRGERDCTNRPAKCAWARRR